MREGHLKIAQGFEVLEAAVVHTGLHNMPGIIRSLGKEFQRVIPAPLLTPKREPKEQKQDEPVAGTSHMEVPIKMENVEDVPQENMPKMPSAAGGDLPSLLEPVKAEPGVIYEPITVRFGPKKYEYKCPLCAVPRTTRSKNAMRGHIAEIHTGTPLLCVMCDFSCYNPDWMAQHEKKHNL
jgi:hypothetical protein